MIFRQYFDKVSSTYTYLISSGHGREALIIDPVLEKTDQYNEYKIEKNEIKVIMSILSNYVPDCLVKAEVSCEVKELNITPIENYKGELDITISVSDEEFTDSISFKLIVQPVNDVPLSYDLTAELVEDDCEDVIILWDDFSNDNTVNIIKELNFDNLKLVLNKKKGLGSAIDVGISNSTKDYF